MAQQQTVVTVQTSAAQAMEVNDIVGGVASSQPNTDGTRLDDELNELIKSQVSQLDVSYKKLASLEKRKEQLDRAITTGRAEDIPNDCKEKKVDLPSLPGGLMSP